MVSIHWRTFLHHIHLIKLAINQLSIRYIHTSIQFSGVRFSSSLNHRGSTSIRHIHSQQPASAFGFTHRIFLLCDLKFLDVLWYSLTLEIQWCYSLTSQVLVRKFCFLPQLFYSLVLPYNFHEKRQILTLSCYQKKHKVIPCGDCYKSERSSDPFSHQHKSTLILTDFCECLTVNHESNLSGCTLGVYTTRFILDIRIWERSTTWLYSPWNMARHWPCLSKLTSTLIALGPCFITTAFAYPYDDIGMCNVPWQSTIDLLSSLSFSAFFFYKSCGASTKTQFFSQYLWENSAMHSKCEFN